MEEDPLAGPSGISAQTSTGGLVDTVQVTTAGNNETGISDPWPYLKAFFVFVERKEESVIHRCVLCVPKINNIRAHISTLSNLRVHMKKKHPEKLTDFEAAVVGGRQKRPSGETWRSGEGGPPAKKQMSLAGWPGSGAAVRQAGVDRRIVDFFVGNMLSLQVIIVLGRCNFITV
jgi:hypothetical protein